MPEPLRVAALTQDIASEAAAIAQALPYRTERGIDPERVVWIDVAGRERVGVAWVAAGAHGPHWMLAIANADRSPVARRRVREIVRLVTGRAGAFELAPPFDGAPHMTMVRVPDR